MSDDYSLDPVDVPEGRGPSFLEVADRRYSRRDFLKVGGATLVVSGVGLSLTAPPAAAQRPRPGTNGYGSGELRFDAIEPHVGDEVVVAPGYRSDVLIAWGDPMVAGLGAFDAASLTPDEQELRHGFNCDFLMFMPLPRRNDEYPRQGVLWVNHEYTDGDMMFVGYDAANPTADQVGIELAAHGASVVEVRRGSDGTWSYVQDSPYNRRITARSTQMRISGPAAGDDRMKTAADPTGTKVIGMLNNCGGGVTPWGTILTAEENFHQYFAFDDGTQSRYAAPTGASGRKWERFDPRFDLREHPNEINRFGWMVEVDPYDPDFVPVKRTGLGRFKHEACTVIRTADNYAVAYSGDDERFDYVYKWVSNRPMVGRRADSRDLLDDGVLQVARFDDDGTGEWLPLVFGQGPLTPANGFVSQADVLIRTREAADALGATPMDRPEDVETNPVNGKLYVALTNNTARTAAGVDGPNPRPVNRGGHVIELDDRGGPLGERGPAFTWEIFLLCGDPAAPDTYFAGFDKTRVSPVANPDNLEFDNRGNLWIATDGQPGSLGYNDAVHAVATEGPFRGQVKQFLSGVPGGEVASLKFTPDNRVLFAAIQHPNEGGTIGEPNPASVWPDGPTGPARPAVVAITRPGTELPIGR